MPQSQKQEKSKVKRQIMTRIKAIHKKQNTDAFRT